MRLKILAPLLLAIFLTSFSSGCSAFRLAHKRGTKADDSTQNVPRLGAAGLGYPFSNLDGWRGTRIGIASWYGEEYHGRYTSNGEVYDQYKLTAAHRALPFNTLVKVTNLKNGKSIIVRINDRGPFIPGRVIDLSYAAARELDMVEDGIQRVEMKILQ